MNGSSRGQSRNLVLAAMIFAVSMTFIDQTIVSIAADTVGHRKMVTLGVIVFAGASAMCGLTPTGGAAEAWIVTFRVVHGVGGALMFPAALATSCRHFRSIGAARRWRCSSGSPAV